MCQKGHPALVRIDTLRYDASAADAALLAPAREPATFYPDAVAAGWQELSIRNLLLAEVPAATGRVQSENPEDGSSENSEPQKLKVKAELPRVAPRPHPCTLRQKDQTQGLVWQQQSQPLPPQPTAPDPGRTSQLQSHAPVACASQPEDPSTLPSLSIHERERRRDASLNTLALHHLVSQQQAELNQMREQISSLHSLVAKLLRDPQDPQAQELRCVGAHLQGAAVGPAEMNVVDSHLPGHVHQVSTNISTASVSANAVSPASQATAGVAADETHLAIGAYESQGLTAESDLGREPSESVSSDSHEELTLVVPGERLRDSADTAGGATPRKRATRDSLGLAFHDVPRIICPPSPSLSSDSDDEVEVDF